MGRHRKLLSNKARRASKREAKSKLIGKSSELKRQQMQTKRKCGFLYYKEVSTNRMMFSTRMREQWPTKHVFVTTPVTEEGAASLAKHILNEDKPDLADVKKLIMKMLRNNKATSCKQIVKIAMTELELGPRLKRGDSKAVDVQYVTQLIRFLCTKILPAELLGGSYNWRKFSARISLLLRTPRYQQVFLGWVMEDMKIGQVKWLDNVESTSLVESYTRKAHLYSKLLQWVFEEVVVLLVANHFYVANTMEAGHQMVFYWKPQWQWLEAAALSTMVSEGKLERVGLEDVLHNNFSQKPNVVAGLMFLIPKATGMRLVVKNTYTDPRLVGHIRMFLKNLTVRGSISSSSRAQLLAAVQSKLEDSSRPLYFVCVDIKDAFGSIKHDILCGILSDIKQNAAGPWLKIKRIFTKRSAGILLDVLASLITRQSLTMAGFNRLYLMTRGVPQGCIFSSALCNLYYGSMDHEYLETFRDHGTLVRAVDDYLYITACRERAESFKSLMEAGFKEYSCLVNPSKTQSNLDDATESVTFCGVRFLTRTLEAAPEFSNYTNTNIIYRSKMCNKFKSRPGQKFKRSTFIAWKMSRVSWHLHKIYVTSSYNSVTRVLRNVFEASLLIACRYQALTSHLYKHVYEPHAMDAIRVIVKNIAQQFYSVTVAKGELSLSKDLFLYIGYRAFFVRLHRIACRFSHCIRFIKTLLKSIFQRLEQNERDLVKKAVEVPSVFKNIK